MKIGKVIVMVVAVVVLTALGYGLASWFLGKPDQNAEGATQLEQTLAQLSSDTAATDGEYAVGDRLSGNADKDSKKATVFLWVEKAVMEVDGSFFLGLFNSQKKNLVKQRAIDFHLPPIHKHQHQSRGQMREVDRHPVIHLAHVGVAHFQRLAANGPGDKAFIPGPRISFQIE